MKFQLYIVHIFTGTLGGEVEEEEVDAKSKEAEIAQFWEKLHHLVLSSPSGSMLRDVGQLEMNCQNPPPSDQPSEDKVIVACKN